MGVEGSEEGRKGGTSNVRIGGRRDHRFDRYFSDECGVLVEENERSSTQSDRQDIVRRFGDRGIWLVLALVLNGWILGTEAHAQFRSGEPSPRPDSVQSLAPSSLGETRSLDAYVRDPDGPNPIERHTDRSRGYDPTLTRGQKLLWGTVGVVVQSFCNVDGEKPLTARPDFTIEPERRTCLHCERLEDRAWKAVGEGLFLSTP